MVSHFGVGAPPILFYFRGDWGLTDLDFDPWPLFGLVFTGAFREARLSQVERWRARNLAFWSRELEPTVEQEDVGENWARS